ncbi:MAG: FapA family protein [Lachnospiraceae bacterium]|nr:FapA family protein [Lachnospiraceae bacterium]
MDKENGWEKNDIDDIPDIDEQKMEALMEQIRMLEAGEFVDLRDQGGESDGFAVSSGEPYVRVVEDGFEAYICIPYNNEAPTREWLLQFLRENGVTRGIIGDTFTKMVKETEYGKEVLIAKGKEPVEGEDGFYEYTFDPDRYKAPHIREDGSVDYSAVNSLANVRTGQLVAVYHPSVPGTDGFKVTGEDLKAQRVKELPPVRGKHLEREGNNYIAMVDGKIEEVDGRIDIKQVHEIHGNVNSIMGKVEFFGDIIVYGDVETGVTLRAGRNIEIRGSVSDAVLFAGGDIIVTQGVSGSEKSRISARGSVFSDFLENTQVKAGFDVSVNSILNCDVDAGRDVMVNGERGVILGGNVHGFNSVKCSEAGNISEIKTFIHVGYMKELYDRYMSYRQQEADLKRKLQDIVNQISSTLQAQKIQGMVRDQSDRIRALEKKDDVPISVKIQMWTKEKNNLFMQLEELRPQREAVEKQIAQAERSEIVISGKVHRGVTIGINDKRMFIEDDNMFMRYRLQYGIIDASLVVI